MVSSGCSILSIFGWMLEGIVVGVLWLIQEMQIYLLLLAEIIRLQLLWFL